MKTKKKAKTAKDKTKRDTYLPGDAISMEMRNRVATPWSMHFDRDGTEDVAVITDCQGDAIVTSRHFWLPEAYDPAPPTLAAVWMMKAAPRMYAALETAERMLASHLRLVDALAILHGKKDDRAVARIEEARRAAFAALCEARGEIPF